MSDLPAKTLILIGYRGSGKTTVARELARRLGWDAIDLDDEIERAAGKSIADVFAQDGEAAFRDLEAAALDRCLTHERMILATGGGIVLREANRLKLHDVRRRGARVVWLRASPETTQRRMAADSGTASRRPNLTPLGGLREIVELLAQRTPLYQDCARLTVDTEGKTAEQVAEEIILTLPGHSCGSRIA
jgi:shikimate kinase